jgi:hypothetical protein
MTVVVQVKKIGEECFLEFTPDQCVELGIQEGDQFVPMRHGDEYILARYDPAFGSEEEFLEDWLLRHPGEYSVLE